MTRADQARIVIRGFVLWFLVLGCSEPTGADAQRRLDALRTGPCHDEAISISSGMWSQCTNDSHRMHVELGTGTAVVICKCPDGGAK